MKAVKSVADDLTQEKYHALQDIQQKYVCIACTYSQIYIMY